MSGPQDGSLACETERSRILDHLEAILAADERRFADGRPSWDPAVEEIRGGLIAELDRLEAKRRAETRAPTTSGNGGGGGGDLLAESNRRRSLELASRTGSLMATWRIHRDDVLRALGKIREGRRMLGSYLSGLRGDGSLDVRR